MLLFLPFNLKNTGTYEAINNTKHVHLVQWKSHMSNRKLNS